jgi:hypothetical protein
METQAMAKKPLTKQEFDNVMILEMEKLIEELNGKIALVRAALEGSAKTYTNISLSDDDNNRLNYIIEGMEGDKNHDQWEVDFLKELRGRLT